jgi:hypothetical protein
MRDTLSCWYKRLYRSVENADQKSVDSILSERLRDSNKANVNTIDMTNLTRKSRVGKLNVF